MSFLDHIRACNNHDPSQFIPFYVNGVGVGRVRPDFAGRLRQWPGIFTVEEDALHCRLEQRDLAGRSAAFAEILGVLDRQDVISHLHGEQYEATPDGRGAGIVHVDRAAVAYFGVRAFGQHINGYVRDGDQIKMWIGLRSSDRKVFPGHLDNLAAGGLPATITLEENLLKECWEEAAIPPGLACRARPVGAITYCADSDKGVKPDTLFCYDLELPSDFEPRCNDDEVEAFYLMSMDEVLEIVDGSDRFKLNCNLVVTDFLVRHGYLGPEHPDYLAIVSGLHPRLPEI
ncbi:MAG: DUF4743 domain-containing protein [Candidatus Sedimenticola endophacoides]